MSFAELKYFEWSVIIAGFLFCSIGLLLLSYNLHSYKLRTNSRRQSTSKILRIPLRIKLLSILSIIFYVITSFNYFLGEIFYYNNYWVGIPYILVTICWGTANSLTYLLFLSRLQLVFQGTANEISKITSLIVIVLIFIFWLSLLGLGIIEICNTYHVLNDNLSWKIQDILLTIDDVSDAIITVILLILFINKLMKITLLSNLEENNDKLSTLSSSKSLNLSHQLIILSSTQRRFLEIATKLTILTSIATLTTQISTIWAIIEALIFSGIADIDDTLIPDILHIILVLLSMLDIIINVAVIVLSFQFYRNVYLKLCSSCHSCCRYCCVNITQYKIMKYMLMDDKPLNDEYISMSENTSEQCEL